jgi:large subunit ribosomal protein L21
LGRRATSPAALSASPCALLLAFGVALASPLSRLTRLARAVVAAAAATDVPSGLNMKGSHVVPPSAGPNPTWQAIIEVGGSQQIVSAGRFYSCHSLPDVRAPKPSNPTLRSCTAPA